MRAALLALLLTGCASGAPEPCAPRTAQALDVACVAGVLATAERECHGDPWRTCPEAVEVMAACDQIIDAHAAGCAR